MNILTNLSIRGKILTIAAVAIVGFLANLAYNYTVTENNKVLLEKLQAVYFPVLERTDANIVRLDRIKETLNAAASSSEMDMVESADEIAQATKDAFKQIADLDASAREDIARLDGSFAGYYDAARALTVGMIGGSLPPDNIQSEVRRMGAALQVYATGLSEFRKSSYGRFTGTIEEANTASHDSLMMGMLLGFVVMIVLVLVAFAITAMIMSNISGVIRSLQDIASGQGDLTRQLESNSADEIGVLVHSFNTFTGKLRGIIGQVAASIAQMASAAEEMSAVAEEGSQNIKRQQKETDQVATATTEMSATIQDVARNVTSVAEAAHSANQEANAGRNVVAQTIDTIGALASEVEKAAAVIHQLEMDSNDIGTVLEVIRGIAEQTNLLALNAAIEAARAGEQGRGFAVVADEVRTLASRTQKSTQEIQKMIERLQTGAGNAVRAMDDGCTRAKASVSQAAKAGAALEAITVAVSSISDMITQIASATEEQSSVAEEINRNVVNISHAAEQTVQGSRQTASASGEMARLAVQLQGLVGQFKV